MMSGIVAGNAFHGSHRKPSPVFRSRPTGERTNVGPALDAPRGNPMSESSVPAGIDIGAMVKDA